MWYWLMIQELVLSVENPAYQQYTQKIKKKGEKGSTV